MRNFVLVSFAVAAVAVANPVMMTFVNEFGYDESGQGWVELHAEPTGGGVDMTNWLLMTSTSACTFAYTMPGDGFLVVDSASLAGGEYGHGTFRLNPAGDRIWVVPDAGHTEYSDEVEFPFLPAGVGYAPLPPYGASSAVCNSPEGSVQTINWYIDSTPTPEADNDDYSTVSGVVTWAPGRNFYEVVVSLSGPMGGSVAEVVTSGQSYQAIGLGAGRYAATAYGYPGYVSVSYPESVDVGYSQVVPGINLDFDPHGVEETPSAERRAPNGVPTIVRGVLLLPEAKDDRRTATGVLLDALGREVAELKSGANDVSRFAPGVYFVRQAASGERSAASVRKVVIQR